MTGSSVDTDWPTITSGDLEDMLLLGGYAAELRAGRFEACRDDLRNLIDWPWAAHGDPCAILNQVVDQGIRGENTFWRSRYVATGRQLVSKLWGTRPCAEAVPNLPQRRFRVEFARSFNLRSVPPDARLRLRMPSPVEDAHLSNLVVSMDHPDAEIHRSAGRIEARLARPASDHISLAATFRFVAGPGVPRQPDQAKDVGIWLAKNEGPIQVSDRVRALAAEIQPDLPAGLSRVLAFRDYLFDTMRCGPAHGECLSGSTTIDWVLDHQRFDCRLGAALLVALCRACGIPARLVSGYLLWDAPTEHFWMEALLPDRGWTPIDLLTWDLSAGGADREWRDLYAAGVDYRMKTQIFPNIFTGAPGVPMTPPWHRLTRIIPDGVETRYVSIPDCELLYADAIRVFTE